MRLIDADAFEAELNERLLPILIERYGRDEALRGLHFSFRDLICNIQTQPTIEPEPQWIPCSERLPESDERVLVYTVANEYHVWDAMTHRGEDYAWEDEEGFCHNLYEVGMWMPLPEPYKEVDDDNSK